VVDDADSIQSFNIMLSVDMIDRGCEAIDEIKYLITDFAARHKNKQLVLDKILYVYYVWLSCIFNSWVKNKSQIHNLNFILFNFIK